MINQKYFEDIHNFPNQIPTGIQQAKDINLGHSVKGITNVIVCGVGGSSLFVELINDILADTKESFRLQYHRGYDIPNNYNDNTLFLAVSYSGSTEETISNYQEIVKNNLPVVVFTSGGKLLELATQDNKEIFLMPKGIQPRLSTGNYIAGIMQLLQNLSLISQKTIDIISNIKFADIDHDQVKTFAKQLVNKVPIIYSTDNNSSISRIIKIKFNENSKVQCFHNYFPELNHNEMQGYELMQMEPYFIILKSSFTHERNHRRIDVFAQIMKSKNLDVSIIDMIGNNTTEEIFNAYYYFDYATYYLAEEYNIDPEIVPMVEEFKKLLG
jgi:glucose/mannose-6-phosphate isomerase